MKVLDWAKCFADRPRRSVTGSAFRSRTRHAVGGVCALAMMIVAACGGSGRPAASPTTAPAAPPSTHLSSSGLAGAGILLAECPGDGSVHFTLIDPATGHKQADRTYRVAQSVQCPSHGGSETLQFRESFSPDLTKLAGTQINKADGSTTAGYYDLASGQWTAAPADPTAPSGFGATARESDAVFSPTTGNLWFRSGKDIMSVKPGGNAIQDRQPLPWSLDTPESRALEPSAAPPFLLAPGSDAPVLSAELLPNPSGSMAVGYNSVNFSPPEENRLYTALEMRAPGSGQPLLNTDCHPLAWISDTQFVCWGHDAQVATITDRGVSVTEHDGSVIKGFAGSSKPLLPSNKLSNSGFIANARNHNVAFLSFQGTTLSLFVTNAANPGEQPKKVLDLAADANVLAQWRTTIVDWTE